MTLRTILQPLAIIALLAVGSGAAYYLLQMEPGKSTDPHDHHDHGEHDHSGHEHDEEEHDHNHDDHDHDEESHEGHDHDDNHAEPEEEGHHDATVIPDEVAHNMGIETMQAGPREIKETFKVTGYIEAAPARIAHVSPQYDGVVQELLVDIGQSVEKGETIATVVSRDTGVLFSVKSPLDGTVLEVLLRPGEVASAESRITIGDISEVWAQLRLGNSQFAKARVDQHVTISTPEGSTSVEGKLAYLSPVGSIHSQTREARVVLPNTDGLWYPGQFISGEIVENAESVSLAVAQTALQTFEGKTVVFVKEGQSYEARPVTLGRQDSRFAEVTGGLDAGETYVSEHSFLIKADLLKSSAGHDH